MVTPQIRPSLSASAKAPVGRALSPATSLRQQGAAAQPKRNVTSKIASLWKRVEDSKTKAKAEEGSKKYKPKDKRIWLGGGSKANQQQEAAPAPGKLIRSGTYEKLTEGEETVEAVVVDGSKPPRSRSRLSMKLSKFSLKRRPSASTPTTSPDQEDEVNGNTTMLTSSRVPSCTSVSTGPDDISGRPPLLPLSNRSPASAIVAPFNYKPSPAAAAVKRNTSYVSSIGRRREEELTASEEEEEKKFQQTSSAMVTLV